MNTQNDDTLFFTVGIDGKTVGFYDWNNIACFREISPAAFELAKRLTLGWFAEKGTQEFGNDPVEPIPFLFESQAALEWVKKTYPDAEIKERNVEPGDDDKDAIY